VLWSRVEGSPQTPAATETTERVGHMPIMADVKSIAAEPDADVICFVCPHPWDAHDRIGIRFCTATAAAGHNRGCVCSSDATSGGLAYNTSSMSR
jgi:hypothetical protein